MLTGWPTQVLRPATTGDYVFGVRAGGPVVAYVVEDYIWDSVISDAWDKELAQVGSFGLPVHSSVLSVCTSINLSHFTSVSLPACSYFCLPVRVSVCLVVSSFSISHLFFHPSIHPPTVTSLREQNFKCVQAQAHAHAHAHAHARAHAYSLPTPSL